jgi:hypothetical protein
MATFIYYFGAVSFAAAAARAVLALINYFEKGKRK